MSKTRRNPHDHSQSPLTVSLFTRGPTLSGDGSPGDASLSRVVEEAAVIHEAADLGLEHAVQLLRLAPLHHLVVVEVHHLHRAAVLRRLQVTLDAGRERGGRAVRTQWATRALGATRDAHACIASLRYMNCTLVCYN